MEGRQVFFVCKTFNVRTATVCRMIEELEVGGKKVVLVGTAHVSEESVQDVKEAVDKYRPDTVCVELDKERLRSLREEDAWQDRDVAKAIEEGNGYLLLFQFLLSVYQRRLGEEIGLEPGEEMLEAVEVAEENDIPVELVDRNLNETFRRAMDSLSFFEKMKLAHSLLEGFFLPQEEIDIEDLKDRDVLHEVITEFAGRFPELKKVFIDERDVFMAEKIRDADGDTVVAVVGAGHLEGIKNALQSRATDETEQLEGRSFDWFTAVRYGMPLLIVGVFVYGFFNVGKAAAQDMFIYWFALNSVAAAIGAVVSFAHPLTVIASFFAAPFTSVNPAVPAGLVAMYVENTVRKPRVKDMQELGAIAGFGEMWKNRATRLLLVFFFVNLGSSIATFTASAYLVKLAGLV